MCREMNALSPRTGKYALYTRLPSARTSSSRCVPSELRTASAPQRAAISAVRSAKPSSEGIVTRP